MHYNYSTEPVKDAAQHLAATLQRHLERDQQVVWLLSGGSGEEVVLQTLNQLNGVDLSKLYVTMTDERFGPVGHPDENWQQLLDKGMNLETATTYRPLTNEDPAVTADAFARELESHIGASDFSIGLFGIGADGHTAGIKPHSEATRATGWATLYQAEDFERLTMTCAAIEALDEAVVQASGEDKRLALENVLGREIDPVEQPAQILKQVPDSYLFTNVQLARDDTDWAVM